MDFECKGVTEPTDTTSNAAHNGKELAACAVLMDTGSVAWSGAQQGHSHQ